MNLRLFWLRKFLSLHLGWHLLELPYREEMMHQIADWLTYSHSDSVKGQPHTIRRQHQGFILPLIKSTSKVLWTSKCQGGGFYSRMFSNVSWAIQTNAQLLKDNSDVAINDIDACNVILLQVATELYLVKHNRRSKRSWNSGEGAIKCQSNVKKKKSIDFMSYSSTLNRGIRRFGKQIV